MRKEAVKITVIAVILLTLSSSVIADGTSFTARLIGWLRSNMAIFRLKSQEAPPADQKNAEGVEKIATESRKSPVSIKNSLKYQESARTAKILRFYNYPNPFTPELGTDFICELEGEASLVLKIFNMNGSLVQELSWQSSEDPPHWDGKDTIGQTVRTGMYIYSLKATDSIAGEVVDSKYGKMMAWYMD